MILWRIRNHATLDGRGGLCASGRWHSRGRRIVYCAPNPAAALIEMLVHLEVDIEDIPARFRLIAITAPDRIARERLARDKLPRRWVEHPAATRAIGDAWLGSRRTTLLEVPSAIVPKTWNMLINPVHPQARRIRIARVSEHILDPRLT